MDLVNDDDDGDDVTSSDRHLDIDSIRNFHAISVLAHSVNANADASIRVHWCRGSHGFLY